MHDFSPQVIQTWTLQTQICLSKSSLFFAQSEIMMLK